MPDSGRRAALLGLAAVALPARAGAQPRRGPPRIAILEWEPAAAVDRLVPFRQALRELGLVEGQSILIDYHFAEGQGDRAEALAQQIVRGAPDIIVAFATPAAHAAKRATATIPIVFGSADPVGTGLVPSLARPGGNLTGISSMLPDLEAKRFELLREVLPQVRRITYIASSRDPAAPSFIRLAREAGARIGAEVGAERVDTPDGLQAALAAARAGGAEAVIIQPLFTLSDVTARRTAGAVQAVGLPAIGTYARFAEAGGLISFGPPIDFARRRAAHFVARILAGAQPGELPVEQPTEFELVINLATARRLGITVPPLVLARADRVIE